MKKEIRILLIEDSPEDVKFVQVQLRKMFGIRHSLQVSDYFSKALPLLQKESFDVIILDLALPDSNGLSGYNRLINSCNIPIIIYTGLDDASIISKAMEIGAMDYLIKGKTTEEALKLSILKSIMHYAPGR